MIQPKHDLLPPENRMGNFLPSDLIQFVEQYDHLRKQKEQRLNIKDYPLLNVSNTEEVNMQFVDYPNTSMYPPTAYLPQSFACFIGRVLHLKPTVTFYLGRIASLITWMLLIFFTLRQMPMLQELFVTLALLPGVFIIQCSLTADVLTNGLSFLFIAFIFRVRQEKAYITYYQRVILLSIIFIIALNKIVYLPLVLLLFLLPKKIFLSEQDEAWRFLKSRSSTFVLYTIISLIGILLWTNGVSENYVAYEEYSMEHRDGIQWNEQVNPTNQLKHVLHHPFEFIKSTIVSYTKVLPATIAHWTGKFGWDKNYMPFGAMLTQILLLLLIAVKYKLDLARKDILLVLGTIITTLVSLSLIMYMIWNPVAHPLINNLGGKYLIPILPLFFLLLHFKLPQRLNSTWIIISLLIIGHLAMVYSILMRYYF